MKPLPRFQFQFSLSCWLFGFAYEHDGSYRSLGLCFGPAALVWNITR